MSTIIRQRRDTEENWLAIDPVIPDGQLVVDKTNKRMKMGDGVNTYSNLPFYGGSVSQEILDTALVYKANSSDVYTKGQVESMISSGITLASLDKSFNQGEMATLNLSAPSSIPRLTVLKEKVSEGETQSIWKTTLSDNQFDFEDSSYESTLKPSGTKGSITLTLGAGAFKTTDINKIITINGGKVSLRDITGKAEVLLPLTSTTVANSGEWSMVSGTYFEGMIVPSYLEESTLKINNPIITNNLTSNSFSAVCAKEDGGFIVAGCYTTSFSYLDYDKDGNFNPGRSKVVANMGGFNSHSSMTDFLHLSQMPGENIFVLTYSEVTNYYLNAIVFNPGTGSYNLSRVTTNYTSSSYTQQYDIQHIWNGNKLYLAADANSSTTTIILPEITITNVSNATYSLRSLTLHGFTDASSVFKIIMDSNKNLMIIAMDVTTDNSAKGYYLRNYGKVDYSSDTTIYPIASKFLGQLADTSYNLKSASLNKDGDIIFSILIGKRLGLLKIDKDLNEITDYKFMDVINSQASPNWMDIEHSEDKVVFAYYNTTVKKICLDVYDAVTLKLDSYATSLTAVDSMPYKPSLYISKTGQAYYLYQTGSGLNSCNVFKVTIPNSKVYYNNDYTVAITKDVNRLYTDLWTSIDAITVDNYENSGEVYYTVKLDDDSHYVVSSGKSARKIVRLNATIWEYNTNPGWNSETWVTSGSEHLALKDAINSLGINKMTKSQMESASTTNFPAILTYIGYSIIYKSKLSGSPSKSDAPTLKYSGNITYEYAVLGTDYLATKQDDSTITVTSLANQNLKLGVK